MTLFERRAHGLEITNAGHQFLRHARKIRDDVSDARRAFAAGEERRGGEIRDVSGDLPTVSVGLRGGGARRSARWRGTSCGWRPRSAAAWAAVRAEGEKRHERSRSGSGMPRKRSSKRRLAELRAGGKRSHWMWFIFPQLRSLGHSDRARYYGIEDAEEARAYLDDPVLGPRLIACAEAVLAHPDRDATEIMGRIDAMKLKSSATLFLHAGGGPIFRRILETFYGGEPCPRTLAELRGVGSGAGR